MVWMLRLFLFAISIRPLYPDDVVAVGAEMLIPPQFVAKAFVLAELVYDQSSVIRNTLFGPIVPPGTTTDASVTVVASPAALTEDRVQPAYDCAISTASGQRMATPWAINCSSITVAKFEIEPAGNLSPVTVVSTKNLIIRPRLISVL